MSAHSGKDNIKRQRETTAVGRPRESPVDSQGIGLRQNCLVSGTECVIGTGIYVKTQTMSIKTKEGVGGNSAM
jgi:hypothetical protein